jgi:hypothetical protein
MERVLIRFLIFAVLFLVNTSAANAAAFALSATKESNSNIIKPGIYHASSKVIFAEGCKDLQVGDMSVSSIKITDYKGSYHASWKADGWTPVRNQEIEVKDNKIKWRFESKNVSSKKYTFVKTVLDGNFESENQLSAKSYHKLYEDGNFVCSYILKTYAFRKKN